MKRAAMFLLVVILYWASPAHAEEIVGQKQSDPMNQISIVGGSHMVFDSGVFAPLIGVHFRRVLHDLFSVRLGYENAFATITLDSGTQLGSVTGSVAINRFQGSILSNGPLYFGLGGMYMTGTVSVLGRSAPVSNPIMVIEAIGGYRHPIGMFVPSAEFRFGFNGPSTAEASLGFQF